MTEINNLSRVNDPVVVEAKAAYQQAVNASIGQFRQDVEEAWKTYQLTSAPAWQRHIERMDAAARTLHQSIDATPIISQEIKIQEAK